MATKEFEKGYEEGNEIGFTQGEHAEQERILEILGFCKHEGNKDGQNEILDEVIRAIKKS